MKVLFLHCSDYLEIGIPGGISVLSAVLKAHGHEPELFDTTFCKPAAYRTKPKTGATVYKKTAYDLADLVENDPVVDVEEAFAQVLNRSRPGLVALSSMTTNLDDTLRMVTRVRPRCPVILGGVHATLRPEQTLEDGAVNMVCVGEGEGALVDLCNALEKGEDHRRIPNLWVKEGGKVFRNPLRPFEDLEALPVPDWSLFDERHLFRPFEGEIYRGSFLTTSRGCPEGCAYCVNGALRRRLRGCGPYFRRQSPEMTVKTIRVLKERHGATWFKFADDTFLLHSVEELKALCDGLRPLNIRFGCSVQPLTVTEEKVRLAKEMGCVAMSVGVESGNEQVRKKILNRRVSNEQLERALRTILDAGIRVSTFNMIGVPGETRENVFDTIRFNKRLGIRAANVYVLYPFPETKIANEGRIDCRDASGKVIPMDRAASFHLSTMPPEELEGLLRTFNLYMLLPESSWPLIREAEGSDPRSLERFRELEEAARAYV